MKPTPVLDAIEAAARERETPASACTDDPFRRTRDDAWMACEAATHAVNGSLFRCDLERVSPALALLYVERLMLDLRIAAAERAFVENTVEARRLELLADAEAAK